MNDTELLAFVVISVALAIAAHLALLTGVLSK